MKIRNLIYLFCLFILLSCKPKYNVIYLNDKITENYEDDYKYFIHLCIAFDSSMVGSKIYLNNFTSNETLMDEILTKTNEKIIKYKWIPNNPKDWDLKINKFQHQIERNAYSKHKYLLVKKIKNKFYLIYTNQSPIERISISNARSAKSPDVEE